MDEKRGVHGEKTRGLGQKARIHGEKTRGLGQKARIHGEKTRGLGQKARIHGEKTRVPELAAPAGGQRGAGCSPKKEMRRACHRPLNAPGCAVHSPLSRLVDLPSRTPLGSLAKRPPPG